MITESAAALRYPVGCECVNAPMSADIAKMLAGSAPAKPTGAARITAPHPLELFSRCVREPRSRAAELVCSSADRQVWPGARRECSSGTATSHPSMTSAGGWPP
ncbi:Uncharacterised protein [Mycobacteroides abscessus subsp. abscessus]|nr:Uncharacterised protein [Mycobacteroides abscessus subsp. abscessus]